MPVKKCPFYYETDEILSAKHNANPPAVMEPSVVTMNPPYNSPSTQQTPTTASPGKPSKRSIAASQPANLHDAHMRIHAEKSKRRKKWLKSDTELQLDLQKQQLQLQKEELRLREKKIEQQFTLLCKQLN